MIEKGTCKICRKELHIVNLLIDHMDCVIEEYDLSEFLEKLKSGGVGRSGSNPRKKLDKRPKTGKASCSQGVHSGAGSNPAPANNSAGASLRRFAPKTKYVCRRHGDGCRSYVEGLIDELERTGRKPTEDDLELVIKSSDYKPPKVICEKCSGMLIGFKTCLCAKEGDNKK